MDASGIGILINLMPAIPANQICDLGCGQAAQFFSITTGRYRCAEYATQCPSVRKRNSEGLARAHIDGKLKSFTNDDRFKSQVSHRVKLQELRPFEELGYRLRKNIVLEEQNYACLHCELDEWMGMAITLELDHIDGNRNNNRRENLRCLCPNCHSITPTWKQGQSGRRKCTDEEIVSAFKATGSIGKTLKLLDMNWGSKTTITRVLHKYRLVDTL
jgi:5-methylcytosine-specific restriction endonuclease McrA